MLRPTAAHPHLPTAGEVEHVEEKNKRPVLGERIRQGELGTSGGREFEFRRLVAYLKHAESLVSHLFQDGPARSSRTGHLLAGGDRFNKRLSLPHPPRPTTAAIATPHPTHL